IYNDHSTLTLSNCVFSGNSAQAGGAIYNDGYSSGGVILTVSASVFSGNSAQSGGGIYNYASQYNGGWVLTVRASAFSGNSAGGYGGAIAVEGWTDISFGYGGVLVVNACTFTDNTAPSGGGIWASADNAAQVYIGDTILKAGTSGENIRPGNVYSY